MDGRFGSCSTPNLIPPVTEYSHDAGGVAITGGYVYRGNNIPELDGQYIFGDSFFSQIFSVDANASAGTDPTQLFTAFGIASFAQGNDGELYVLQLNGPVHQLTGGSRTVEMPDNLSETGCFNVATKTAPEGVFAYQLNSQLWSDGAEKERFFAIPDETLIEVAEDGDFIYPQGSVLVKNFLNGSTYLETRLLVHHDIGWRGYSYEWNGAQTDALLLSEGKTVDVGDFVHTFPSASECFTCHTGAANESLGPEVIQLNRDVDSENQLGFLSDAGYLDTLFSNPEAELRLFALDDTEATVEQRARSYLHSNCSGCHRPNSSAALIDLRFTTALADTNACDQAPTEGDLGVLGALRIDPGDPDNSVLVLRMEDLTGDVRMPPLASLIEDEAATALIRQWITELSGCN